MTRHTVQHRLAPWIAAGLLITATAAATPRSSDAPAPRFRDAVETHLAAVAARDLEALLPTLTERNDLTLILPDGRKLDTREQFVELHRDWFASDDDGRFEYEIVRLTESTALGHALVKYRYTSRQESGEMRTNVSWLALTFALEDDAWRLVFDQNTRIEATAAR